jgi:alkaline phosphatase
MKAIIASALLAALVPALTESRAELKVEKPQNIILMIADGAGYQHFTATALYLTGSTNGLACDDFPVKLAVTTFSASGRGYDPQAVATNPAYVKMFPTDSAAAATAMATGNKTENRSLGVDVQSRRLSNAVETAVSGGRLAGLITSVPFSHATPAGFSAHLQDRDKYAGIARQMVTESPLTVLMGCGHPGYDANGAARTPRTFDYGGGADLWGRIASQRAEGMRDGRNSTSLWTFIDSRAAFVALASGPAPERVLGVAPVYKTLQQERSPTKDWNGDGKTNFADAAAAPAYGDPLLTSVPTLAEMTRAALNVLDDHPAGFFLMVEGGAADWASHNNHAGRMIEEMVSFNESVQAVCDWVEAHGGWEKNLVIVTADHETGYLRLGSGPFEKGRLPLLTWSQKDHTNQLVPLFAKGVGAERLVARKRVTDPVRGPVIDNTDIGRVLLDMLGNP